MSNGRVFSIIAVCGAVLFLTRALPFIFFGGGKKIPRFVSYLGSVLPPGIMAILIIYSLREASVFRYPFALPELLGVSAAVLIFLRSKSTVLSILCATALYMLMVQGVFV